MSKYIIVKDTSLLRYYLDIISDIKIDYDAIDLEELEAVKYIKDELESSEHEQDVLRSQVYSDIKENEKT